MNSEVNDHTDNEFTDLPLIGTLKDAMAHEKICNNDYFALLKEQIYYLKNELLHKDTVINSLIDTNAKILSSMNNNRNINPIKGKYIPESLIVTENDGGNNIKQPRFNLDERNITKRKKEEKKVNNYTEAEKDKDQQATAAD